MSVRNNLKDKLEDGELDLSMMQLVDVPVREIEQLGTKEWCQCNAMICTLRRFFIDFGRFV